MSKQKRVRMTMRPAPQAPMPAFLRNNGHSTAPQSVAEWRAKRREGQVTLPSGLQVDLRKVTMLTLVATGQIPQTLITYIDDIRKRGIQKIATADFAKFKPAVDSVTIACIAKPRIVATEAEAVDDDHVWVEELDFEDRIWVFNWANRGAASLQPFPVPPASGVVAVQPGSDVEHPAEPPAGS